LFFAARPAAKRKRTPFSQRFVDRLETRLHKLAEQAQAGKTRDRQKVERQIGRLLERNSRAASLFRVEVWESGTGPEARLSIQVTKNEERYRWAMETGGSYILRTNWSETDPQTLWKHLHQLTEVEDSFRTEKYDLGMRPISTTKKIGPRPISWSAFSR